MDWRPYITADPEIMHGAVWLKPEHIPASIAYAADLARERVVPIPA